MDTAFPDLPLYQGWGAPVRVRSTFHGMWVSENTLTTGRYVA
jgi:hypothetical protein